MVPKPEIVSTSSYLNATATVDSAGVVTITLDGSKRLGRSKAGKSEIIATSGGNQTLFVNGEEVKLGFTVYQPLPKEQQG